MKSIKVLAIALLLAQVGKAYAGVPGTLAGGSGTTPPERAQPTDGSGRLFFNEQLGYKVFTATSSSPIQLTDELNNNVTCGSLHAVATSSGTAGVAEFFVALDSNSAGGQSFTLAGVLPYQLAPPLVKVATSSVVPNLPMNYQVLDAQFNKGLILWQNTNAGMSTVFYRPCNGGRE